MSIGNDLYEAATALAARRYPTGWAGAAAVRLATGEIVTSIAPDVDLDVLSLCMEVGGMLEAHKRDEPLTHSLCVVRESEKEPFRVLSPCGVCQERLRFWGADVLVAITNAENALVFRRLLDLQPHHWSAAYRP